MGAVSGDVNTASFVAADAADLASRPIASLRNGDRAYVTSKASSAEGALFFLDRASVLPVDGVGVLAASGGVGRWLSEAFYGSMRVPIFAANVAALTATAVASFESGELAWVDTFRSYFRYDRTSVAAPDGKTVVNALGGAGRWLRLLDVRDLTWARQPLWEIDEVNGDDENTGEPGSPLATNAEFLRRVNVLEVSMTVTVLGAAIAEPFIAVLEANTPGLSFIYQGTRTVRVSGTILAHTDPVPATNSEGTLTSAAVPSFVPYVGRLIQMTSGPAIGGCAAILADAAGVAQIPYFGRYPYDAPTPNAGDSFTIATLTTIPTIQISSSTLDLAVRNFDIVSPGFTMSFLQTTVYDPTNFDSPRFEGCEIGNFSAANGMFYNFEGCSLKPGFFQTLSNGGTVQCYGTAIFRNIDVSYSASMSFMGCIAYGATISAGESTGGDSDGSEYPVIATFTRDYGLGVFNSPADGIRIGHGGKLAAYGGVYGDGNVGRGILVEDGGVVQLREDITPFITGAVAEVSIDSAVVATPGLVPGAVVPANAAMTTWAQWAAAPFSRCAHNYATASRIVGL
jgi:hypothetical protein